jgi:hypothetical protein
LGVVFSVFFSGRADPRCMGDHPPIKIAPNGLFGAGFAGGADVAEGRAVSFGSGEGNAERPAPETGAGRFEGSADFAAPWP